jgi:TRAP-type C4-dicarboxylate transport system permease large subunit
MLRRGYKHEMAVGPIVGSAGLSMIIPPSGLGIILASLANLPVSDLFMAGYLPGFLMAALYAIYIGVRCRIQPWYVS